MDVLNFFHLFIYLPFAYLINSYSLSHLGSMYAPSKIVHFFPFFFAYYARGPKYGP